MIAVVDIETTGTDYWRSEVLTLSIGIYFDGGDLFTEKEFKFKPVRMKFWSEEAAAVHKITKDEAINFPDANDSWGEFFAFLDSNVKTPIPFVCHALWFGHYFDRAFLECQMFLTNNHWLLRKYFSNTISTHTMAQTLRSVGCYNFEKLTLNYLADWFKFELDHHDAKSDRETCAKIYFKIREKYNEVYEEKCRKEAEGEADENQKNGSSRAIRSKVSGKSKRKSSKVV